MIKRTIKYTNFADETVSEDWYFHVSKAEAVQLEMSEKGGLTETLQAILIEQDGKKLFRIFKETLLNAVGKRSADGKRFNKSQEIIDEFVGTGACDELVFQLLTDSEGTAGFFRGMLPTDAQVSEKPNFTMPDPNTTERVKPKFTLAELQAMDTNAFNAAMNKQ